MLSSILGFLLVITIIVFVHELGHYVAARLTGVRIIEFSIGFGKTLLEWKDSRGTIWKISLLPFGGYVRMFGDKDISSSESAEHLQDLPINLKEEAFALKPPYKRAFIAVAGPFANYLLAAIIIVFLYSYNGRYEIPNEVANVLENSPAEKIGIKEGDKVISIYGKRVRSFDEIIQVVTLHPNTYMQVVVIRDQKEFTFDLTTEEREIKDKNGKILTKIGVIGIASREPRHVDLNLVSAINYSLEDMLNISVMTFTAVKQMVFGSRSIEELRGTFTIAAQSGTSIEKGFQYFILYIASLSINIGFVNLLPIPILDGGHIVYCLYEMITRRKPSIIVQSLLNKIGLMLVIFLFVISTSNDIKTLLF